MGQMPIPFGYRATPAAASGGRIIRHTDKRKDAGPFHSPCCAHYVSSVNNSFHACNSVLVGFRKTEKLKITIAISH